MNEPLTKATYKLLEEIFKRKCTGITYSMKPNGKRVIEISPITIGRINASIKKEGKK